MAKRTRRKNGDESPDADEARSLAQGFHGRDNRDEFEEDLEETVETDLAQLGELVEFEIVTPEGKLFTMPFDRKSEDNLVRLCASADRKQLYLIGGDQCLEDSTLEKIGANTGKNKVIIGNAITISYFADKHHLTGPKQQAKGTEYIHSFGEQTFKRNLWQNRLELGLLPQLVYNKRDEVMELVGGKYEIRDEGIWN